MGTAATSQPATLQPPARGADSARVAEMVSTDGRAERRTGETHAGRGANSASAASQPVRKGKAQRGSQPGSHTPASGRERHGEVGSQSGASQPHDRVARQPVRNGKGGQHEGRWDSQYGWKSGGQGETHSGTQEGSASIASA